ncbi:MAG TPA: L,D-transpeptidase, partial [Actinomycetota bacterium]|nr:L,D-transpeptidase [Actinomycetota bacterium]
ADAVLAFHKVQGMNRSRSVGRATWRRLSDPRLPSPRSRASNVHVEIDQSKQVLYVVRQGEIDDIVHTSTGAGGATRDGVFHVFRKIAGYSPNRLYYPSYFDGGRAVHGWPQVPTYPASHGCARVPYWAAKYLHALMGLGMEVRVYH